MKQIASICVMAILILTACKNSNEKANRDNTVEQYMKANDMTYPVKHISVSINRPADDVYQFASNPENMPKWVKFIKSVTRENDTLFADSDLGKIKMQFVPQNDFGVIDHLVTLPDGARVNNIMRVIANGEGSELIFTLTR